MAYYPKNSFSLLYLALFGTILVSQGIVEARGTVGINPFCKQATSFRICNIMVRGAKTQAEAAFNAVQSTRVLASQIPALTAEVANAINTATTTPEAKAGVQKQCTEVFQNVVDDLDASLTSVKANDMFSAAVHLSAVKFDECSEAMEEFGVTFPMHKIVIQFERQVSSSLAVVQSQ